VRLAPTMPLAAFMIFLRLALAFVPLLALGISLTPHLLGFNTPSMG
jgi:hypothetical protein